MKGLFIPDITAEMFRNGCLEGIEALMAEGEIYDIDYTGWIPVSERLPEDDALMIVTFKPNRPDEGDVWIGWHEMENVWFIDGEEHSKEHGNEVIAWRPLPAPYKESDNK